MQMNDRIRTWLATFKIEMEEQGQDGTEGGDVGFWNVRYLLSTDDLDEPPIAFPPNREGANALGAMIVARLCQMLDDDEPILCQSEHDQKTIDEAAERVRERLKAHQRAEREAQRKGEN
jgi:hypothetical protein